MGFNQLQLLSFWSTRGASWGWLLSPSDTALGSLHWSWKATPGLPWTLPILEWESTSSPGGPGFLSFSGKSRPQPGIHTDPSKSSSEHFFFLTYLLDLFCITPVSPFDISSISKSPGLKDTRYKGLQYPITIHLLYPTLYTTVSE